jgi:hypothetical protein
MHNYLVLFNVAVIHKFTNKKKEDSDETHTIPLGNQCFFVAAAVRHIVDTVVGQPLGGLDNIL